ncbi:4,5:9,10-diseco-3-hydroxy-5,9,17-trioxoandrosta-1(10),2-diene-4-oate hydrolase [Sinobacterium caligoides]|uniref:4,5:9,10-diseco-3-hydroxy-5,9, 17-trioxoandrosta-1(10),2-diene-4-oate hydrolase n=1 Tax=Sinobacterium caligoides TaxID=933926 RepID=A0A3N2DMZ5_9GAMM|nr:alpha/beta hydrolase [Sinobacterium caligoides]ROS01183.1 4,5:9,10-diseco-3-hydroxy-5,9,17-trioxoandrosta-1(10),2-diene-4-oate hydrolase [Sinobacterium caligoides]
MNVKDYLPEGSYSDLANGQRIHYLDIGQGPVVVFLHGSGSGASGHSNFKLNYQVVADQGYRVIVPDLIGYGLSDKPEDVDYHLDFFVECVKLNLDDLGLDRYTLVGNSLGGAIALKYALDYPQHVERMLLMAPGGIEEQTDYFTMPGMKIMRETFMSPEPVTPAVMRNFISQALVHQQTVVTDELVQERWAVMQTQNPQVIKTMVVPNMASRLGEISCPVLGLWGGNEIMMPESGFMTLAKGIKNIRMTMVSECGHWVMVEHVDYFNRTLIDFLEND